MYGDVPGRVECESKYKLDQYGARQCSKDCKLNISDMSVSSTTSWLLCEVIKPNTPVSRNTKRRKGGCIYLDNGTELLCLMPCYK